MDRLPLSAKSAGVRAVCAVDQFKLRSERRTATARALRGGIHRA
ncbi:hypothetical protein A33K_12995 [Burkholderia humptydooensis MSMB43]|uniref:Uncharacterized protein n=1 Tax=Burkholderia humptydooensis MSMB43 TaxID=441157 RepID=A0ABN0GB73_9BURK|nr:hypothetical protein A33K_12995 [Burkholderia humptydooensis MSMB43]